jgi:hypothetical protein
VLRRVAQRCGSGHCASAQSRAFVIQPLIEFRGHAGDVETFEKISAVERQCLGDMPSIERSLEFACVEPDRLRLDTDFLIAATYQNATAERLPEEVKALTERPAGLLDVGLGPEEGKERVAAVEARPSGKGEVCEEGETLRLDEYGPNFIAPRPAEVEPTEDVEPQGWRASRLNRVAVIRQVTVAWRRGGAVPAFSRSERLLAPALRRNTRRPHHRCRRARRQRTREDI